MFYFPWSRSEGQTTKIIFTFALNSSNEETNRFLVEVIPLGFAGALCTYFHLSFVKNSYCKWF